MRRYHRPSASGAPGLFPLSPTVAHVETDRVPVDDASRCRSLLMISSDKMVSPGMGKAAGSQLSAILAGMTTSLPDTTSLPGMLVA